MAIKCEVCERELENYSANIMVGEWEYPNASDVHVICKQCTRNLDSIGIGKVFHNMWELGWLKEDFEEFHTQVIRESADGSRKWGQKAKDKITAIGKELGSNLQPL